MTLTMKSENITRKLDSLGRITLPKSLRARLNIADGAELEVFTCDYEGRTYICLTDTETKTTEGEIMVAKLLDMYSHEEILKMLNS